MAVTIELRYDFDANNFFDTQAKRDMMQLAANNIADQLTDSLSPIVASGSDSWTADFLDPATGAPRSVNNLVVPASTLEVFVGGRPLNGDARTRRPGRIFLVGIEPVGCRCGGTRPARRARHVALDEAPWGGAISFDSRANWFFGTTTGGLTPTQTDFLSVAEHEIGHVLGIGDTVADASVTSSWAKFISNGTFVGLDAMAAHGAFPSRWTQAAATGPPARSPPGRRRP